MHSTEPLSSLEQAGRWIAQVGVALAFPQAHVPLPSLWAAAHGYTSPQGETTWDEATERMWAWKDQMAEQKLAWYGTLVVHKPTLLAPDLLPLLMALRPSVDAEEQWKNGLLSGDAWRIVQALQDGPQGRVSLRSRTNMAGKEGGVRFTRAIAALEQALLVARVGVWQEGGNWPSTAYALIQHHWPLAVAQAKRLPRRDAAHGLRQRLPDFFQATGPERAARLLGVPKDEFQGSGLHDEL